MLVQQTVVQDMSLGREHGRVGAKLVQRKACLAGSDSMGPSSAEMRLLDTSADGGGKSSKDVSLTLQVQAFSFCLRGNRKEIYSSPPYSYSAIRYSR